MESPGSTILHELFHFIELFLQAREHISTIETSCWMADEDTIEHIVIEFFGAVPVGNNPQILAMAVALIKRIESATSDPPACPSRRTWEATQAHRECRQLYLLRVV
jgi:hypothetical protein